MDRSAIIIICSAVYVAGFIVSARWRYARLRPYTEPVSCRGDRHLRSAPRSEHSRECYQRPGTDADSEADAAGYACGAALVWPLLLLYPLSLLICGTCLLAVRGAGRKRLEREQAGKVMPS